MASEELRRWREQLAAEDSDDEGLGGYGAVPPDLAGGGGDLGLGLDDLPPPRLSAPGSARDRKGPPARATKGPPRTAQGMARGDAEVSDAVLYHKVQVLQSQLEEKELELEGMRHAGAGDGGEMAVQKMRELAKRSKAATMALGRERAETARLKGEVAALRREAGERTAGSRPSTTSVAPAGSAAARLEAANAAVRAGREAPEVKDREIKELRERSAYTAARLHEAKLAVQSTRAELARYQRALAKEVGEDVGRGDILSKLLEEGSGAKGRAQQITLLRQQVRDLQRKLSEAGGAGVSEVGASPPHSPGGVDEKQRLTLASIESERRRELERLMLREAELEGEVSEGRKKVEAMGARIRILEADVRGKKEKLKALLDKSDADDQLVHVLRDELEKLKRAERIGAGGGGSVSARAAPRGMEPPFETDAAIQNRRLHELQGRASTQQAQIDRQEQIILSLRDQLQRAGSNRAASPANGRCACMPARAPAACPSTPPARTHALGPTPWAPRPRPRPPPRSRRSRGPVPHSSPPRHTVRLTT